MNKLGPKASLEDELSSNLESKDNFYISNIPKEEEYLTYINEAVLPKRVSINLIFFNLNYNTNLNLIDWYSRILEKYYNSISQFSYIS